MYAGHSVWNRTTTRMRSRRKSVPTQEWIAKSEAFQPIIDQHVCDSVQLLLRVRPLLSPNRVILKTIRRLLKTKGRLSLAILRSAPGLPSLSSLQRMFGSCRRLYQKVGYQLSPFQERRSDRLNNSIRLRRELIEMIRSLFPNNIVVLRLPHRRRSVLLIDGQFMVSVLFCSPILRRGKYVWIVEPNSAESGYITLLCPVKRSHERALGYFVFPHLNGFKTHFLFRNDPFLNAALKLNDISEFYATAQDLWAKNQTLANRQISARQR